MAELDESSLLKIFSMVGCARSIARFSLVCKQWRDLSYSVSVLVFEFQTHTKEEVRSKEGIISGVLCRAGSRAPGNLKCLTVSLTCMKDAEVSGHWLTWATSLIDLRLHARFHAIWGPIIWNSIVCMETIEHLSISGRFYTEDHLLLPRVLANKMQIVRLEKCVLLDGNNVSVPLLETILATCPALAECGNGSALEPVLRVASNSLKTFSLLVYIGDDVFDVRLDAPHLTTLTLSIRRSRWRNAASLYFESVPSLREVCLNGSFCKLCDPLHSLQKLEMCGGLTLLLEVITLTRLVTELCLHPDYVEGVNFIDMDNVLATLVNLRDIHFYEGAMRYFHGGQRRAEALTVHLWPSVRYDPEISLLKALIEVHKIQSLVVHCKDMVNYATATVNDGYEKWLAVFALAHFYPDQMKFVRR